MKADQSYSTSKAGQLAGVGEYACAIKAGGREIFRRVLILEAKLNISAEQVFALLSPYI